MRNCFRMVKSRLKHQYHKENLIFCLLCVLCALCVKTSPAQEWYEGTGIVTLANITPEEARRRAFDEARINALSVAGVEVTGFTGRHISEIGDRFIDNFIRMTSTQTRGLIVAVDTLFDGLETQPVEGGRPVMVYRARIRAQVESQIGKPDPGFTLNMSLNRETYRHNDPITIVLTATRDCRVTIFSLDEEDSLSIVFPNSELLDNRLVAGDTLMLPPAKAGWELPVTLAPGRESAAECLLAVAMKDDVSFQPSGVVIRDGLMAQGEALLAVNRWLSKVDAGKRTQTAQFYRVVK